MDELDIGDDIDDEEMMEGKSEFASLSLFLFINQPASPLC